MATKTNDLTLDPTETPVIFGLWQLIPSDEPQQPPKPNLFMKYMSYALNIIATPFVYLFYLENKIPLAYGRAQQLYLIFLTLIIPAALFCLNYFYITKNIKKMPSAPSVSMSKRPTSKIWNQYIEKLKAYADGIQNRTASYMICIWAIVFTLLVAFYPRLQNVAK
jgi:hypothetical protein